MSGMGRPAVHEYRISPTEAHSVSGTDRNLKQEIGQSTPLHVLLVEDNAADAAIIGEMIRETGVESSTKWLKDGEAVIRHLKEGHRIDVIILDLNMPKMDGHALLAKLLEMKVMDKMTVVVLTGSSSPLDKERVRKIGIDLYLIKPMGIKEMDEITKRLRSILTGARSRHMQT